ncbi:putative Pilus assembly protein [Desulfosarcina cetonica]|nr:putative Pilus assembly protein [Desulfosarcina cetonica]
MHKHFLISIVFILTATGACFADDWIDNWIQQATANGPNMFESQKRGYASAGSLSLRFKNEKDYLVSFAPPRFRAGCGGIDMFLGSFSYLDAEYLMEKLERIAEGGVATFVYDIAMSVLSEPIQKSMKSLEALVDRLNQLQIDDCQAAKGVSAYLKSTSSGEDQSEALQKFLIESGINDFYQGAQDDYNSSNTEQVMQDAGVTVSDMTSGCPEEMRRVFFKDGSLLANVAVENNIPESQTRIMSAFVGDVLIDSGRYFMIGPCYNDPGDVDALVYGDLITRDAGGACSQLDHVHIDGVNYDSLYDWAYAMIREVITSIGTKTDLSPAAQAFIESMPSPVYMLVLNDIKAVGDLNDVEEISGRLAYVGALSYAYQMSKSLLFNTYKLYHDAMRIAHNQLGPDAGGRCVQQLVEQPAGYIETILGRLDSMYGYLEQAYSASLQRITNDLQQERLIQARSDRLNRTSFDQTGIRK